MGCEPTGESLSIGESCLAAGASFVVSIVGVVDCESAALVVNVGEVVSVWDVCTVTVLSSSVARVYSCGAEFPLLLVWAVTDLGVGCVSVLDSVDACG